MTEENIVADRKIFTSLCVKQKVLYSAFLERDVIIDFYLPNDIDVTTGVDLLLINDGQDLQTMNFAEIADRLTTSGDIEPVFYVGIHCGIDRMNEYGTICQKDYKGRGARAGLYSKFIFDELLPFISNKFNIISFGEKSFAGFSLGGLSAMDIVWNHANEFSKVGVFSGSLWWRRRGYEDEGYDGEKDRIMHLQVQKGNFCPWLHFFFECGLLDETADRNNNGIIDSIEDTTDLIVELKKLGYPEEQIRYIQLEDGRHDITTWSKAFPEFLKWGWGKTITSKA